MIIGIDQLMSLVLDPKARLIIGLGEKEMNSPEGTGFDLRVGKIFKLKDGSEGFMYNDGLKLRKTPEAILIAEYNPSTLEEKQKIVPIIRGDYYLMQTIESFRVPENLLGIIQPRTTLFRSGVLMGFSFVSPGYGLLSGDGADNGATLTFSIVNMSSCPFKLQLGARVAHIVFPEIEGSTHPYLGQWQKEGGRLRTDGEKQR